jgi:hypothetical protein
MPRFLRSVRLALHPAQTINQCFLNGNGSVLPFDYGKISFALCLKRKKDPKKS